MSLKLNIGNKLANAEQTTTTAKPNLANLLAKPAVQPSATQPVPTSNSLASVLAKPVKASDLASLEFDLGKSIEEDMGITHAPLKMNVNSDKYVFDQDASEKLPPGLVETFAEKMGILRDSLGSNAAFLQTAMYDILKFTNEHKELRAILREQDVAIFTRAARESYGFTVVAKETNQKKGKAKAATSANIIADLSDLTFDI